MIMLVFLCIFLFVYMGIIIVIIRQSDKQSGTIIFSSPKNINQTLETNEVQKTLKAPPYSSNIYLNAIAVFLLEQKEEIPKIVKFIETLPDKQDRNFILNYLYYYDRKLYDHVVALQGIDTSKIEDFTSRNIDVEDPATQLSLDYSVLTPEESVMVGGIPKELFLEDIDLSNITNPVEYYDHLNTVYIARILNDQEKQEVENQAQKIIEPIKSSTSSPALQNTFREGKKVAKEIIRELEQKDNDKIL